MCFIEQICFVMDKLHPPPIIVFGIKDFFFTSSPGQIYWETVGKFQENYSWHKNVHENQARLMHIRNRGKI